ncbi:hypothetical protein Btru_011851 [Bulinus truncatus]|nr:hypothetical protein Btru_011851 [Bulinus truncatus]
MSKHFQKSQALFSRRMLLYTNTGLCVITSATSDVIQQNYQRLFNDENRHWNPKRTGKMAATGLAFGPSIHYWYLFLEKLLPGCTTKAFVLKICMDQFIFSPFCITAFLLIVGLLEKQGTELLKEEFTETGVLMFLTDCVIWTPAQAVNFYFIPTKYRVLYDNSISLMVDTFYSYLRFERETSHGIHAQKGHELKSIPVDS